MTLVQFISGVIIGLMIGRIVSNAIICGLDYWSRRMSVATLYMQWGQEPMEDDPVEPEEEK